MKRRAFLAAASMALWGRPVLGELLELPGRPETPTPLPARLGAGDVEALHDLTEQIRSLARSYGGYSGMIGPVASRAERMLDIPHPEELPSVVAELNIVAGWASHDAGLPDAARHHFTRAIDIASEAGDHYKAANTLVHAGIAADEQSHPGDAVKMYQLAQVNLANTDDRRALGAWIHGLTASAHAHMDRPAEAREALSSAEDAWTPPNGFEGAMWEWRTADTLTASKDTLDRAEAHAAASVNAWRGSTQRRDAVLADILLATIHVRSGERDGPDLARRAIAGVAELRSTRARDRLAPLVGALKARPGSEARELAQHARRVAAATT